MRAYLLRRLTLVVPTLLLVTLVVFCLVRLLPGDVVRLMAAENGYAADAEAMRQRLGLDDPIHLQYLAWLGDVLRGDLGTSLWTGRSATEELLRRVPVSLELGGMALVISLLIALPIGAISAVYQDSRWDYLSRTTAAVGQAMPSFWMATLVIVLPSVWWGWSPQLQYVSFAADPLGNVTQFLLPAAVLGVYMSATVMRMTRAMVLEVLRQDYVRTAHAKGLRGAMVLVRHTLPNALIPVVTIIGLQVPVLLGGTVVIEWIFGLPGLGGFMLDVVTKRDYPMIQAINLFFAALTVAANLVVDVLYGALDPRLRHAT